MARSAATEAVVSVGSASARSLEPLGRCVRSAPPAQTLAALRGKGLLFHPQSQACLSRWPSLALCCACCPASPMHTAQLPNKTCTNSHHNTSYKMLLLVVVEEEERIGGGEVKIVHKNQHHQPRLSRFGNCRATGVNETDLVLGPEAPASPSLEHTILCSERNVCDLLHVTTVLDRASPEQCFIHQARGNGCIKQTVIRRQIGWKGADLERDARSRGFGFFCSIYANDRAGRNVEVVQATDTSSALGQVTQPDDHPPLCSSHNKGQLQESSRGASWSTGMPLAIRTCWITAASSLE